VPRRGRNQRRPAVGRRRPGGAARLGGNSTSSTGRPPPPPIRSRRGRPAPAACAGRSAL
ncbi:MAG: hypothetical protein AVDCRST_MAG59-984, partial [uncultured Thermomicrobiales bacterium]